GPLAPSTGQIDVYRFWAINPGAVAIKTLAEPGSHVNTTVRVYKAGYAKNGVLILQAINGVNSSQDWYPADRSAIDAQNYITDFASNLNYAAGDTYPVPDSYGTGGGMYFAVVRNEEGSLGTYRLEVDSTPFPFAGDAQSHVTAFPPAAGTIALNVPSFQ